MLRIRAAILISLGLGALLAWLSFPFAGLVGAGLLVAAAVAARVHWARRQASDGDDPGAHEREAWHALVGFGAATGHWITALAVSIGGHVDLHVGSGNNYANDNWTILAGALVAFFIVRASDRTRDERDRGFQARGTAAGYASLTGMLIVLLLFLAYAPVVYREDLDQFIIANILLVLIELAVMAKQAVQLHAYWQDARDAAAEA